VRGELIHLLEENCRLRRDLAWLRRRRGWRGTTPELRATFDPDEFDAIREEVDRVLAR